eukprot:1520392-Prorocentrum_lima.AAC.1
MAVPRRLFFQRGGADSTVTWKGFPLKGEYSTVLALQQSLSQQLGAIDATIPGGAIANFHDNKRGARSGN